MLEQFWQLPIGSLKLPPMSRLTHFYGILYKLHVRGGDGLRVCRRPQYLHGVWQVPGRTHAPALHAHAAP